MSWWRGCWSPLARNDEANAGESPRGISGFVIGHWSFVIDSSFEFRYSSFARDGEASPVTEPSRPLVEIMVPTLNEADHIAACVTNASRLGPVYVLDSLSTDGTQDLARPAVGTVVEHAVVNHS